MLAKYILYFLVSTLTYQAFGSTSRLEYSSLGDGFFTIDKKTQKALILFPDEQVKKCYLLLGKEEVKKDGLALTFASTPNMCLFVDNNLVFKSIGYDTVHVELNTLNLKKASILTFYSPSDWFNHTYTHLSQSTLTSNSLSEVTWLLRNKIHNSKTTLFLITILLMLILIKVKDTLLWNSFFKISYVVSNKSNSENYAFRSMFSLESILVLSFISLLGSFLLSEWKLNLVPADSSVVPQDVIHFVLIFLFFVFKFFFLSGITWFLGFSNFNVEQFLEYIRFSIWLYAILLFLELAFGNEVKQLSKIILFAGVIGWNFRILVKAIDKLRFQKLYLFSYICASELIPAIVLINIIDQGN